MNAARIRVSFALAVTFLLVVAIGANAGMAQEKGRRAVIPFNGKNLDGWKLKDPAGDSKWKVGIARMDPQNPGSLLALPTEGKPGEMVNAGGHSVDIYTERKFGDATISLEVMVPRGSNSGIYVMGEYEIQVFDSFGRSNPRAGDMGGLYGVKPPRVNACKRPGEWQTMVIEVKAPRFADGKKVSNVLFKKITLNGQVIHENVEVDHALPGGVTGREVPEGPLMFQGNHGQVAFRNIKIAPAAE